MPSPAHMITVSDLITWRGRIGRLPFALGTLGSTLLLVASVRGAEALLPWMAEVLAPHGINAGFALNGIWLALGLAFAWVLSVLGAKRLRDIGRSPWWAPAAAVPLGSLALLNDAIFLVSRSFTLPRPAHWIALAVFGAIAAWVLIEGLRKPDGARPDGDSRSRPAPQ